MRQVSVSALRGRLSTALGRQGNPRPDQVAALREEIALLRKQTKSLRAQVSELQTEVQECRRMNRRIAELTDVVEELLVPAANRNETVLQERLELYQKSL